MDIELAAPEVRFLLNPALCGLLIRDASEGYQSESGKGMPFELSFLVLPLAFHEETRQKLPSTIATKLHPWLQEYSYLRIGFENRARALVPFTRSGLAYAIQGGLTTMDHEGNLTPAVKARRSSAAEDEEREATRKAATFLGRWFGRAGNPSTIYTSWGIRP